MHKINEGGRIKAFKKTHDGTVWAGSLQEPLNSDQGRETLNSLDKLMHSFLIG